MDVLVEQLGPDGRALAQGPPADLRGLLDRGEALHRAFRPDIGADYSGYLELMFGEGARLAQLVDDSEVRALAVWRRFHTTHAGHRLHVDDLVTDARQRSRGYGRTMIGWLEAKARALGCDGLSLDSGTQRKDAHRFYLRERFDIAAFHFVKTL